MYGETAKRTSLRRRFAQTRRVTSTAKTKATSAAKNERRKTNIAPSAPLHVPRKAGYNVLRKSVAGWCNGSTPDSGSGNLGSSPSPAATPMDANPSFGTRRTRGFCFSRCVLPLRPSDEGRRGRRSLLRRATAGTSSAAISLTRETARRSPFRRDRTGSAKEGCGTFRTPNCRRRTARASSTPG